ncbi:MAG: zinc-binding dehydrogenase, partial [Candidatus Binataceae bacterium]
AFCLARLPDGIDFATAAAIPEAFVTAYDALFLRGALRLGASVLIHAIGSGVGLAALALARRAGARTFGTSRTPAKLERARELGLEVALPLADGWSERVLEASGGRGVNLILDFIGAPALAGNLAALAPLGRIVQIGTLGGAQATLGLGTLMQKRATLVGTVMRSRPLEEKIALHKVLECEILPLVANGELGVEIDRIYPLAAVREAHARMEGDQNLGKILLDCRPDGSARAAG